MKPTESHGRTMELLRQLCLPTIRESFLSKAAEALTEQLSYEEGQLLELECTRRHNRSVERRLLELNVPSFRLEQAANVHSAETSS